MMWIVLCSTLFASIRIILATINVGVDGSVCIYQFWFGHLSFVGEYMYIYIYVYIHIMNLGIVVSHFTTIRFFLYIFAYTIVIYAKQYHSLQG
jgi:hypothetical protein